MELHEGVRLAVVLAGTLDDALEAAAVLRVDEDHDVATTDGLGQEVPERDAFAGLGRTDQQGPAFEVLQRTVERVLLRFDAMDVREADLGIGLRTDCEAQQSQQVGRNGIFLVVDLRELIQALRMDGQPLEAETEEHLARVARERLELPGGDDLHGLARQRGAHREDAQTLARSVSGHHQRHQRQSERDRRWDESAPAEVHEEEQADQPRSASPHLVGRSPRHFVVTDQHCSSSWRGSEVGGVEPANERGLQDEAELGLPAELVLHGVDARRVAADGHARLGQ